MILMGALANGGAVVVGGLAGVMLRRWMSQKLSDFMLQSMGLAVLYVGISGSLAGSETIVAVLSIAIGSVLGHAANFDRRLEGLGLWIQSKIPAGSGSPSVAEGFVTTTLFVCVGAMGIVGALQSGVAGDHSVLLAKSLIDGVTAMILGATLGMGVALAGLSVFLYEALLTLCASAIAGFLPGPVVAEISCVGGLLIVAIALNMLKLTDIKIANLLPAPFLPILLMRFFA